MLIESHLFPSYCIVKALADFLTTFYCSKKYMIILIPHACYSCHQIACSWRPLSDIRSLDNDMFLPHFLVARHYVLSYIYTQSPFPNHDYLLYGHSRIFQTVDPNPIIHLVLVPSS